MPNYQVTVRHGTTAKRYFMLQVEAVDIGAALAAAGAGMPAEVRAEADLVEVRPAPDPEAERPWLGGDAP